MDFHRGKCDDYKPIGHACIVPMSFPKCTHTLILDGEPFLRECSIQVASSQPTKTCISNVLRITYNLSHNHTRLQNFNNPYPPSTGISSLSFPNRGNVNNTIQCPNPMLCVVSDLAIMSTSYENVMPNAMSFNINTLNAFYI